jgi:hypothetical protein
MKTIYLFFLASLLNLLTNAQEFKRFDCGIKTSFGSYFITAKFDTTEPKGNQVIYFFIDDDYGKNLFQDIVKEAFSPQKLKTLPFELFLIIDFNLKGEAIKCRFRIRAEDIKLITDDDLYNVYIRFKGLKLDMTKLRLYEEHYNFDVKYADYFKMGYRIHKSE